MFEWFILAAQHELPPKAVIQPQQAMVRAWDGTSEGMSVGGIDRRHADGDDERHGDPPDPPIEKVPNETGRQQIISGYTQTGPLASGLGYPHRVW